jgi:hypothetical protein
VLQTITPFTEKIDNMFCWTETCILNIQTCKCRTNWVMNYQCFKAPSPDFCYLHFVPNICHNFCIMPHPRPHSCQLKRFYVQRFLKGRSLCFVPTALYFLNSIFLPNLHPYGIGPRSLVLPPPLGLWHTIAVKLRKKDVGKQTEINSKQKN